MVYERIARGTEALEMDVRRGIHRPLTLRRSGWAVNGRNGLMTDGTSIVTLGGIQNGTLHIAMPDGQSTVTGVCKKLEEG